MDFKEKLLMANQKVRSIDMENSKIIIWGMGDTAVLYESAFRTEKINIYAYTGMDAYSGGGYNGYPVITPEEILDIDHPLILVNVKNPAYIQEIENKIKSFKREIPYLWVDEFIFGKNVEVILKNIQCLEDEKSKRIYEQLIMRKMYNEKVDDLFEGDQYWAIPSFRAENMKEVFVDLGGFVGDTLEKYLFVKSGTFQRYYIFEPDENNYKALIKRIKRLNEEWNLSSDKIIPVFSGVGSEDGQYYFKEMNQRNSGSHYTIQNTGIERKIVKLDSYFKDISIDFLKADIESYEFDMLLGAVEILKRDRPKLAISIYHNATDMYNILDWLKNMQLGYKFYIRHHSVRDAETVLYAICDNT